MPFMWTRERRRSAVLNRRAFCRTLGASAIGSVAATLGMDRASAHALADVAAPRPLIRIGANENPYGLGPAADAAIQAACAEANRYPRASIEALLAALTERHRVTRDQIVLACGSGDILRAAVTTFTSASRPLVTAAPTFEGPSRRAEQLGVPIRAVPVTSALSLDLDAMATQAVGAGLVFLCNPNNPTGTIVPAADVAALVAHLATASPETKVLVDEAYFEYATHSSYATAIPLIAKSPNVLISRTFSKIFGMAGMRVGYAITTPQTAKALGAGLSPMGLSGVSIAAATAALGDTSGMADQRTRNMAVRKDVRQRFEQAGYKVAPSEANFVMVDVRRDVRGFQEACRARGVQIARPFPPLTTWARITVGTPDEMATAMDVFLSVLSAPASSASVAPVGDHEWVC
jgi:histidinol-phosphate aminotransferase